MTLHELWEKYGHLDELLTDREWLPGGIVGQILYDVWQVVRTEAANA